MSTLLFLLRVPGVMAWVLVGLLSVALFPLLPSSWRSLMNRYWSRALLFLCGVSVRICGRPALHGPVLWVANHVSWLDIFVLNSVRPTIFIAKSDIRRWPLIGWLVAGAGTVFIERGQRHAVRAVGRQMKARFERGEAVGLFPEGTTSGGLDVAAFHSSLLDPAVRAGVGIQPVALCFWHRRQRSDYVSFVGTQTLVQNAWRLLGTTGVRVECHFLDTLTSDECQRLGRSQSAARARELIRGVIAPASKYPEPDAVQPQNPRPDYPRPDRSRPDRSRPDTISE